MSFKNVLGQRHAVETFSKILKNDRLANSYLFLGIDGIGKSFFAKQLAKSVNCQNGQEDSCDECQSCKRIDAGTSPDVYRITLEKDRKLLGIKSVKTLQDAVALKPVESKRKVFIIEDANKLTEEASNCLLKTLEEPPLFVIIILLVNSLDALPETIISRCRVIRFFSLPEESILNLLRDSRPDMEESLSWFAQVSNGSIGTALSLIDGNIFEKNEAIINSLSKLKPEDNFSLSKEINEWLTAAKGKTISLEEKRLYLKTILNLILHYYRDILIYKTRPAGDGYYFNKDCIGLIEAQSGLFSINSISVIINHIFRAFEELDANVNTNLLIENLITRIALAKKACA